MLTKLFHIVLEYEIKVQQQLKKVVSNSTLSVFSVANTKDSNECRLMCCRKSNQDIVKSRFHQHLMIYKNL